MNVLACLFYVVCMALNLAIGAYILQHQNQNGTYAGSTLEQVLATEEASLVACLVSFLIGLVFLRSSFEAMDSPEMNKMFHDLNSIAVIDSLVFDAVLSCALVAPILCLYFGGKDRHLYYILLDASEIYLITGGLFIFRTLRCGEGILFQHLVYLVLLGGQILFYLGLGVNPSPLQQWYTCISGWLHFAGLAAIAWDEYVYDWKRTMANIKSGRLFEFNTAENIVLCFNIYNIMTYLLHWSIALVMWWHDSTLQFSYLNYSHNTVIAFLVPCLVVEVAVIVTPKRLDERTKRLLAQMIVSKSNQSAEMLSLSRKYMAEKHKHRQLLERMLPARVINELQLTGSVAPERLDNVTIFFCDMVGFTNLAARLDAIETAELLNSVYQLFDKVVEQDPRLYKIETVGDEFMVCAGAPYECEEHFCAIADLALLLLRVIQLFLVPSTDDHLDGEEAAAMKPLRIRAGIHTGSVVGAVMGSAMPRYTLVGDTVNTASRMESTGLPDKIQVSNATAIQLLKSGKYVLEQRGEIDVKGKGSMMTHWLVSASSAHDMINEAYIAELLDNLSLSKFKTEESRRMKRDMSDDSMSVSTFSEAKKHVLFLASSYNEAKDNHKHDQQGGASNVVDALLANGYDCTFSSSVPANTSAQVIEYKYDILLVDLDSFSLSISNLAFTAAFKGPVILMKSFSLQASQEEAENRLLLFKPFDVDAFHRIVSNLY